MTLPKWLVRTGQVVLVIAVTYGIVRALVPELGKINAHDFAAWKPDAFGVIVSLALLLVVYLTHCMLWRHITTRLGGVKPGLKSSLRIYFVSSLGRYIPGKLWQIAGLALLAQQAGISPVAATAASVTAQLAFMSAGLVYLGVLMPDWGGYGPFLGLILLVGIVEILFLSRSWWRPKLGQKMSDALALIETIRWQDALKWWLVYAATWILLGVAFVLFVQSFAPLDQAQMIRVAGTVAASYLAGYVFLISMAGLGVREGVMVGLLSGAVLAPAGAIVVSVLSRLWFTAAELLPLLLIPIMRDEKR
ncbi:MAG TPA: lysylphosphatidylglycerol synthase domain-containing protein [Longimicrobiales bacterium]|nr:lysylphosphatidylglycerol synthase domain-containing protein [Longimicrobiales bacterium]